MIQKQGGGWTSFSLTPEDGKRWNLFGQKLAITNPEDPNPYFSDYLTFINELKVEQNKMP